MDSYKSRRHCLLLYPDDPTHVRALDHIEHYYRNCYILHDKDVHADTGELKKPHYHVIVEYNNAKYNTAIAKELGITLNYIQECRNYTSALEYLIHYNEETKYQYPLDDVKGELKAKLIKTLNTDQRSEDDKVMDLIGWINNYSGHLSVTRFAQEAAERGMWDVFRRSAVIYIKIIDEHNQGEQL